MAKIMIYDPKRDGDPIVNGERVLNMPVSADIGYVLEIMDRAYIKDICRLTNNPSGSHNCTERNTVVAFMKLMDAIQNDKECNQMLSDCVERFFQKHPHFYQE